MRREERNNKVGVERERGEEERENEERGRRREDEEEEGENNSGRKGGRMLGEWRRRSREGGEAGRR